jgi:hypothetical protein
MRLPSGCFEFDDGKRLGRHLFGLAHNATTSWQQEAAVGVNPHAKVARADGRTLFGGTT